MTPADVIREARNVLFERGWHKGSMYGPGQSGCLLTALGVAAVGGQEQIPLALRAIHEAGVSRCIPLWNDAPSRTFDDVIDMLDKAEKIAERAS